MSDAPNTSTVDQSLVPPTTEDGSSIDFSDPVADPLATASAFFNDLQSSFGSGVDSLFSAGNSLLAHVTGVSKADVDAGKVDPLTLSREQRAQLAIDGNTGGPFPNPWHVGFDVGAVDTVQLASLGGGFFLFDVEIAAPLAALDKLAPPGFALLADDSTVLARGSIDPSIVGSTPLFVKLAEPSPGAKLTLWVDSTLTATLRKVGSLGDFDAAVAAENAARAADSPSSFFGSISKTFDGAVEKFFQVEAGVGILVVVVVAGALFLFIESGGPREVATALRVSGG